VRISELADRVGVATSTVRYYERVGLLTLPERTGSGYRDYDANCSAAHERVGLLIDEKRREINERIRELKRFAAQLDTARAVLDTTPPPDACRTDLSCCMPDSEGAAVAVEFSPKRTR
jgi:DNA-binding transcriptional MerR regulator